MHNRCHDQHDQTIPKKFEEITVWKAEKATNTEQVYNRSSWKAKVENKYKRHCL